MRHGLIEEAKAELDAAYESVAQAELELLRISHAYRDAFEQRAIMDEAAWGAHFEALFGELRTQRELLDLSELHRIQRLAMNRFSLIAGTFDVAWTFDDPGMMGEALTQYLFRRADIEKEADVCNALSDALANAIFTYFHVDDSNDADSALREAWDDIETRLRRFGRQI